MGISDTSRRLPAWDVNAYSENDGHHRLYDGWFLESTPLRSTDQVLDVGCGPGVFSRAVADLVPAGIVIGLDPHVGFLTEAARRAGPNQQFVRGVAQNLIDAVGVDRFDGVISRSALQWVPCAEHHRVLQGVWAVLKAGGWFRLEMSGAGNIRKVVELLDSVSAEMGGPTSPWCFPDPGTYHDLLETTGFALASGFVRSIPQRRRFSADTVVGWLRSQVYAAYEVFLPESVRSQFGPAVERRIEELRREDGTFDQTFVRLDLLAWKPEGSAAND